MEEKWVIRRIRTRMIYGVRPDRSCFAYPEEEIVTGKGKTMEEAKLNFQTAERIKYEPHHFSSATLERLRPYQY